LRPAFGAGEFFYEPGLRRMLAGAAVPDESALPSPPLHLPAAMAV
jgi:hypothetical protein